MTGAAQSRLSQDGSSRLSVPRIESATKQIDPVFLHSPQFQSEPLSSLLDLDLTLKLETLNPIRSFKGRRADLFVRSLPPDVSRVVCGTAGNFGQGLAYAGNKHGLQVVVFAAKTANQLKIQRMRQLGAQVRLSGSDFDAAKEGARDFAEQSGSYLVEDGRETAISEGAGTIAVELCSKRDFDYVVVPLGGGALLAGMAKWIRDRCPRTKIVGVSAVGAPAMALSLRRKKICVSRSLFTVADGIAVRVPVPEAVSDLTDLVDDVLLVGDRLLIRAMQLLFRHHGLVSEPAGVAGLAGIILANRRFRGSVTATPICGGNLSPGQVRRWLTK